MKRYPNKSLHGINKKRAFKPMPSAKVGACCIQALFAAAMALPITINADDALPGPMPGQVPSTAAVPLKQPATSKKPALKPAYTLKIITYGEGQPEAENLSEQGLQQNRRVDVTIVGEPEVAENESKVELPTGGVMWITKDPLELNRQLSIKSTPTANTVEGELESPIRLRLFSNYASYLARWEVVFFNEEDTDMSHPVATIEGDKLGYESELEWNGVLTSGQTIEKGTNLNYVLRVYDAKGRVDETFPETISVYGPQRNIDNDDTPSLEEIALEARKERSRLARQEIDIRGSRVRLYGRDLVDTQTLSINGEKITLDENSAFATEYLLPTGKHNFDIDIVTKDGGKAKKQMSVDLDDDYLFLVALADATLSQNKVSGSIDRLEVDDDARYGGDMFIEGRLAFYLKGKIKGKYLITAQADTETNELDKLFEDFTRANPASVFRRLDPEQYYPVYGDDSTLIDDTDSQGKLYVRVDWDQSRVLWGNYNSGITGTELARFNRSLYGAQLLSRSTAFTTQGEHKSSLNAFASQANSAHRHNEFLGTGGSLYYLSDRDIVTGSEKLAVEVRQSGSSRVVDRVELVEGRDYQIDDIQGRIILNRPLQSVSGETAPSIIKDTPLNGNEVWLVADYEYIPAGFKKDDATVGGRAKHWLNDHFALGGTYVLDRREGFDHQIKGVDATISASPGTWLRAEFAQSNNAQASASFTSNDGGLNFAAFQSNTRLAATQGNAIGLEGRVNIANLSDSERESSIGAWYKQRDKDFSSSSFDTGAATTDTGAETSIAATERITLSARATQVEREDLDVSQSASLQAEVDVHDRVSVGGEYRALHEENLIDNTTGDGSIGAVRIGVDVTDHVNVYAASQYTIEASGTYANNDLNTVGITTNNTERLSLNAEASSGDRGDSALLGFDYKVLNDYSVYANHTFSTDRTDSFRNTTTLGQRRTLGSKLRVFTEHQFTDEEPGTTVGHTFGLDYKASKATTISFSYQMAKLDADNGGTTDRDAASVGLGYKKGKTSASSRIEYRRDKSDSMETQQWLTANSINLAFSPSVRWQGKLNYSQTEDQRSGDADARFAEAGIGFAFRPVSNDRLNMLGRITYKYDLPPLGQSSDVDERATVASLEGAFQFDQHWEIGGKAAYKESEIRMSRDLGLWTGNDAVLGALRLRYHMLFNWDALAEYHWLFSDASSDTEHGALISVGRHVGDHLKLSAGYNFTRFDDSLLNDNIDIGGWFINLVGKY